MAITNVDPQTLVQAHKGGDSDAFPVIVRTYYEGLLAHAVRQLGDPHAAEDAVQETLVRAYKALPRFNGQYHLRAWLHRILTNVCHDEGNRRRREGSLTDLARSSAEVTDGAELEDDIADRIDASHHEVVAALASLPESYRQALVLRYVEDLSFRELAERTGLSEGNARARVHRGRAALRRALGGAVAVFVFLIPGLRRGQRPAIADVAAGGLTHSSTHVAPLMTRLAESGAGQMVAERAVGITNALAVAATMAVPVAAPMVGNTLADRLDARPPAVVAAAPLEEDVAGDDEAEASAGARAATAADEGTTATTLPTDVPPTTVATAGSVPETVTSTTMPQTSSTTVATPPTAAPPSDDTDGSSEPGGSAPPPLDPASTPIDADVFTDRLTAVSTSASRIELQGTDVAVRLGGETLTGTLAGNIRRAPGGADSGETPPADDGTEAPADETESTEPTAGDGGGEPEGDASQHAFSSDLSLTLEDGRSLEIRLTGWLVDAPDGSWALQDVTFELFDPCHAPIGSGTTTGSFLVEEAPVPSSLELHFDGVEQAPAGDCTA